MALELGEKIGGGSFGQVCVARYEGKKVVVKSSIPSKSGSYKFLRSEKIILCDLADCENIINCLGDAHSIDKDGKVVYHLVLQYVDGGDINSYIDRRGGKLPEHEARHLAYLLTKGLAFIHSKGYVHCDIKPGNILVSLPSSLVPACIRIADFGLAKKVGRKSGPRGTKQYMSPEAVNGQCEPPMDVWGLGCVVLEMLTGKRLLSCMPNRKDIDTLRLPSGVSNCGKDFLRHCFNVDPRARWTADMLLHHPFLDLFFDTNNDIASSLEFQFHDLRSEEKEDSEEDGSSTVNAFLNFLGDLFSSGKGTATRWDEWFEKNVKDSIIDISSDHMDENQCSTHGKKRKINIDLNTTLPEFSSKKLRK